MCTINLKVYASKIFLSMLLLICSVLAFSQQRMRFIGSDSTPVEKATVRIKSLLSENQSQLFVTDKDGIVTLRIDTGRYLMAASFVGMELINDTLNIQTSTDTFQYIFKPLSVELYLVTITSKKNILDIQGDKIVYNVGADEMARSKSLSQVLGNVPLLLLTVLGKYKYQVKLPTRYSLTERRQLCLPTISLLY
ncbi:hypothetical protein LWM68_07015 [Niabella sp. W65]|nr:hypothetical protein [Niabella sp. W65]MCH7362544.1 hypothetical protein [Niabella sp. W65]